MRRTCNATVLVLLPVLAVACGAPGSGGNFDVEVQVDPTLMDRVEIVSMRGDRPGATNPIDAEIVLANRGDDALRLELDGRWEDGNGRFQGGAADIRDVPPGGTTRFSAGTHTTRAEAFRVAVRAATGTMDERLTETLVDATPKPAGRGMTYTESPWNDEIPVWSPRGSADGAPFTAETMLFRHGPRGWILQMHDMEFDPLEGFAVLRDSHPDLQWIELDLSQEPASGAVLRHGPDFGGGYFQIRSPSHPGTTSWNTTLTWIVEFTTWNRQPWSTDGPSRQIGGTASGKLYAAFRGAEGGLANSWVSGTFENVPIVYYGPPPVD